MEPGELEQFQYKIKLKEKSIKGDKVSLYIETYKGTYRFPDGKKVHYRDFEYLKLYIFKNPKTIDENNDNDWSYKKAKEILRLRIEQARKGKYVSPKAIVKDKLLENNTLTLQNLIIVKNAIQLIEPKDRTAKLIKALKETIDSIDALRKTFKDFIDIGDIVKLNKNHKHISNNPKRTDSFKVLNIKAHAGISDGVGYEIISTNSKYKDLGSKYVSRNSLIKV